MAAVIVIIRNEEISGVILMATDDTQLINNVWQLRKQGIDEARAQGEGQKALFFWQVPRNFVHYHHQGDIAILEKLADEIYPHP